MVFEIIGALFLLLILMAIAICILLMLVVFTSFLLDLAIDTVAELIPKIKSLKRGGRK